MSDEHDLGLAHDLTVLDRLDAPAHPGRRRALQVLGAAGAVGGMSGRARGIP